jgi:hypothetical protein
MPCPDPARALLPLYRLVRMSGFEQIEESAGYTDGSDNDNDWRSNPAKFPSCQELAALLDADRVGAPRKRGKPAGRHLNVPPARSERPEHEQAEPG